MRVILIFVGLISLAAIAIVAYLLFGVRTPNLPQDVTQETVAPAPIADGDELPPPAADLVMPTFDIVRVDQTGEAVIAGRATPGTTVEVRANGDVIGTTTADQRGEWTMIVETPLDEGDQELVITSIDDNGWSINSEQVVVVAVPDRPDELPLVVLSTPDQPSQVLQAPQDGVRQGSLVLSSVDYDDQGNVIFAGEADAGAPVRVYVGDRPVGATRANEEGQWMVQPVDPILPGLYTLRVDLLSEEDGSVLERIEVPFERALPSDVVLRGGHVVVQPGNSLWRISRAVYGEGVRYTVIYEANAEQIRDPDLIYPGQIFDVPNRN